MLHAEGVVAEGVAARPGEHLGARVGAVLGAFGVKVGPAGGGQVGGLPRAVRQLEQDRLDGGGGDAARVGGDDHLAAVAVAEKGVAQLQRRRQAVEVSGSGARLLPQNDGGGGSPIA